MVVAANSDLYTPFSRGPVIEEGFQSSEEGSDLHSPIIEVPYPQEVRYHLGHLPDVTTSLIPSPFAARYPVDDLSPHAPGPHILETLQVPSSNSIHHTLSHPHPHTDYGVQQHSILNLEGPSTRLPVPALSTPEEFTFNLPQSRLLEPQVRLSHEPLSTSSRGGALTMASAEPKLQITPSSSASGKGSTLGSNPTSTRPPRREASTVVIACRQCRARKIRCDSNRPNCNNCTRRNNECEYDAVPKRRGPDKRPGTRQRSCKKRPPETETSGPQAKKKRKTSGDHDGNLISFDVKENITSGAKRLLISRPMPDETSDIHIAQPTPLVLDMSVGHRGYPPEAIYPKDEIPPSSRRYPLYSYDSMDPIFNKSFARPVDVNLYPQEQENHEQKETLPLSPSTEYSRRTWWDHLLDTYCDTRERSMKQIFDDLKFLLTNSSYWLFFFNVPVFFQDLRDPQRRMQIQPSLITSALAMATLMQSSEIELGSGGRERALRLRNDAQASLMAACNSQAIDYTLAEAALILALFESSCHPQHCVERANSALQFLDRIVHALSLSFIDVHDTDASVFTPGEVPTVFMPDGYISPKECACIDLPPQSASPLDLGQISSSNYSFNPPWDITWNIAEMRKEECRRICWSALTLVASHTAQCAAFHLEPLELSLIEPSNYALLFPGEAFERSPQNQIPGQSPKESVWALYCRSMLLWNSCIRPRDTQTTEERAQFAIDAWRETHAVQLALDIHYCNSDTALMYLCREYLYNTRMTITYEFRRLQDTDNAGMPMFNRRQAKDWLYYQDQVAKRVKDAVLHIEDTPGHLLTKRPFQVTWFSSQVAICLALWNYDPELYDALELAKAFLLPLDALNALWPCHAQRMRRDELRQRLEEACNEAGLRPPLSPEMSLPPILSSPDSR